MGLGKTAQVIALLVHRRQAGHGPSLVVAPTSVLSTWLGEFAKFAPDLRLITYHGSSRRLPPASGPGSGFDVVVTSFGVLARDREQLAERS